jgi:ADP-ribose pyrophosphatase YjhB (NUDIX family)
MGQVRRQAAVIPYRIRKERLEVALVTRSGGKGWIVPKGSIDDGERSRDAAIREAEEEAGLRGVVTQKPLGSYRHTNGDGRFEVDVYLMRVTSVLDEWLEDRLASAAGCASPMRPLGFARNCRSSFMVSAAASESVFVVHGDWSGDAITNSLRALLPTRERAIAKHRFTLLDTFDGRVRRAGARLTRSGDDRAGDDGVAGWPTRKLAGRRADAARSASRGIFRAAVATSADAGRWCPPPACASRCRVAGSQLDVLDDQKKTIASTAHRVGQGATAANTRPGGGGCRRS